MKFMFILLVLLLGGSAKANDIVDVHGVNHHVAKEIKKRYEKRVQHIETKLMKEFSTVGANVQNPQRVQQWLNQKNQLVQEIKQHGHFAFVDLQTVNYPGKKNIYTTIEIVQSNQKNRLSFIPPKTYQSTGPKRHDLIELMIVYQHKAMRLLMSNQLDLHDQTCPVYHCTVPFTHPTLKPYLALFNQGVIHEKPLIIETLNHDKNPERRAAAAFLVGHFHDPHEIITLLLPHVTDQHDGVRNNVLRVIGETIARAHITEINALPFLTLLDSPYVTDRNKALLVLLTMADSEYGKKQIIKHGRARLLTLHHLKQPNNHDIAEMILKKTGLRTGLHSHGSESNG